MLDEAAASAHLALVRYLSQVTQELGVGEHVYVVGGAVRNFVLGAPIKDIDLVIDSVALGGKDSEWLAKQLQKKIPAATNLTTNQYGVAILTVKSDWELEGHQLKGEVIEIANAREESYGAGGKGYKPSEVKPSTIKADVYRREFTFNTLMWRLSDLASGPEKAEIVDITGCGLRDLKAGTMRCPSDPDKTFSDDPTRMLRAIKFLVKYGFKVEGEVADAIRRNARKLLNAPHEAISTLLIGTILHEPTARAALKAMDELGLLAVVAEMLATNREFAQTMANWANNKKVAFLFDLLDYGLPLATPLDFLKPDEQKRLRQVAATLPSGEAEELLAALKQPGKALGDKSFLPKLAAEKGIPQKDMKDWAPKVAAALRAALLDDPRLLKRPDLLQAVARAVPGPKTKAVEEASEAWKREGYRIEFETRPTVNYYETNPKKRYYNIYVVKAYAPDGTLVGTVDFAEEGGKLMVGAVTVDSEHRRKGLATAMYRRAEKETGLKVGPALANARTADGGAFRAAYRSEDVTARMLRLLND